MKVLMTFLIVCLFSGGALADNDKDRKKILDMRQKILTRLYKEDPGTKAKIQDSVAYATFSNMGINLLMLSTGRGSGVLHHNKTGEDIYMKMFSAGVGIGLGIKDFMVVFIFNNQDVYEKFLSTGWDFSGQADAAAKSNEKGGESSAAATVIKGVDIYQMTENGLALQVTLQGTKYWQNDDLNKKKDK